MNKNRRLAAASRVLPAATFRLCLEPSAPSRNAASEALLRAGGRHSSAVTRSTGLLGGEWPW